MSDAKEFHVIGHPGTGKTTYLASQVRSAAIKYGSDRIIVASFTRAAAHVIAGRDLSIPRNLVGTLHSHCYRALGENVPIAELNLDQWNQEQPQYYMSEGRKPEDVIEVSYGKTMGDKLYAATQILRAKMRPQDLWPGPVRYFYKLWNEWKSNNGLIDFTDMIEIAYRDMDAFPSNPSVGFFDETQDFTKLEIETIRKLSRDMDYIVFAGDPNQSIYQFKGSTPDTFLDADIPHEHVRVLPQSYRVPISVQRVASRWIGKARKYYPAEYRPRDEQGSVDYMPTATIDDPIPAINDAEHRIGMGKEVMFLTTCSYMLNKIIEELRKRAIPFHNPYRRTNGAWNPLKSGNGTSASERLLAFLRPDENTWGDDARLWSGLDILKFATELRADGNIARGKKGILKDILEGMNEVSPQYLRGIFTDDALEHIWNMDLDWLSMNLSGNTARTIQYPINIARKRGASVLRERPKCIVGTMHSAKGGEVDDVYVFPDLSMAAYNEWKDTRSYDEVARLSSSGSDSIYRLFYVAMTRCRERLIICDPAGSFTVSGL